MERKVIQLAKRTQVISLPNKWVKKYNIKKGDSVEVKEQENKIIITPNKTKTEKTITLNGDEYDKSTLWYALNTIHNKNYSTIQINWTKKETGNIIKEIIKKIPQDYIGMEVTKQGKNHCIIQEVSEPKQEEYNKTFLRILHIITTTLEEGINIKEKTEREDLAKYLNFTTNRLTAFCIRLAVKNHKETEQIELMRSIEQISDECCEIIKKGRKEEIKECTKIISQFKKTCINPDLKNFKELNKLRKQTKTAKTIARKCTETTALLINFGKQHAIP
ncbi:hypothetical protein DRJ22_04000 [Candidatus Woesearchaeota archaeon]|nr:MAG: hypothetical protein DRJ22_04000 [Candidatus Woesearchaeota archaeon]